MACENRQTDLNAAAFPFPHAYALIGGAAEEEVTGGGEAENCVFVAPQNAAMAKMLFPFPKVDQLVEGAAVYDGGIYVTANDVTALSWVSNVCRKKCFVPFPCSC